MTTDTNGGDSIAEYSSDSQTEAAAGGLEDVAGHRVTDTLVGYENENHRYAKRGAYPKGLDPDEFVGTLRRFVGKSVQYLTVVGDFDGHAVYRMLNEGRPGYELHAIPWDEFIERTVRVNPDALGTPDDDPGRTVIRTDFDTLRRRREEEVRTGCTCLPPDEACDHCGGKGGDDDD